MHGFDEVRTEFKAEFQKEIGDLRKEMRAEFKLVHQEMRVLRETHDRRLTRLEEKIF